IVRSFEIAAERCEDLAPAVYARLFRELPQVQPLFRKDSELVRGEMLARTIDALLDYVGDRAYGQFFISSEAINHTGYEVAPETFVQFFRIVSEALRDVVGADWTSDMTKAWRDLLDDISTRVREAAPV
ncbi:MAG: globin, partial [Hyphomicrobiales bacterium]|nr:globin [Hyphomicrobiales bacterium]